MSIRITELDAINSLQDGDYVAVDNESTGTHKFKALDISANLAGNIANTYSSSASYAIGQYCLYNNNLYRCTTTISTPEAWNGAHWVQVTVGEGLYDKVDKVSGKALSANDFTNAYKTKLDGIEAGAEVNVQANWTESDNSKDDYIKNKPVNATQSTSGFMSASDKQKLDSIASGAEVNVQANWTENDSSKDDYIKNKPTIDETLNLNSNNAVRNSAITAGINQVQSNLDTEITNRQNAVSGEQLARENADNALDGRLDTVEETLPNKANIDGSYDSMTVGNAEQLVSNVRENDKTPYLFRTSGGSIDIGDREYINGIVGGTVAWNQLISDNTPSYTVRASKTYDATNKEFTVTPTDYTATVDGVYFGAGLIVNHVYLQSVLINPTSNGSFRIGTDLVQNWVSLNADTYSNVATVIKPNQNAAIVAYANGTTLTSGATFKLKNLQLFDLTQMFGSTIADYIYSLETATAGAGVAWFKKLFNKPYYAYNAGELKSVSGLVSHDTVGFNLFDKNAISEYGKWLSTTTGLIENAANSGYVVSDYIRVFKGQPIYIPQTSTVRRWFYTMDKTPSVFINYSTSQVYTPPEDGYIRVTIERILSPLDDICINLAWDGSRNGEYEPYELHSYPLDSDLTLRGIPKLDANNNLYYDGDTYEADGTVTRKYAVVDLGTLTWGYDTTGTYPFFRSNDLMGIIKNVTANSAVGNMLCSRYKTTDANTPYAGNATNCICEVTFGQIQVYDTAYTSASDFKTAMSGVYLVYELAEPTTETADTYQQTEIVSDFGTEEFVIDDDVFAIPVGHNTDYPVNLVAKLEMAPNSPDGNGDYIVRQVNGENTYVPLVIEDALPTMPSTAGTYKLTITVTEGSDPVLSWEAE